MNKALLVAALLATASVNAYATNSPERIAHGQKQSQKQNQKQSQKQNQKQGQAQTAKSSAASNSAGGSADNAGNEQAVTLSSTEVLQRNNTPDIGSVLVYPTANCRVAYGGGLAGPGFGIQMGSSEPSEVCELIEISKQLKYLGLSDPSILIMCQEPRAAKAMGKICPVQTSENVSGPPEIVKP